MRYNCTKEGMGGSFKCIHYGGIYQNDGTCTKEGPCPHKEPHPVDLLKQSRKTHAERTEEEQ